MQTSWIVQTNVERESTSPALLQSACSSLGLPFHAVTVIAGSPSLIELPPIDGPVVFHGRNTLIQRALQDQRWRAGVFFSRELRLDLATERTEPDDPFLARVCQKYRAACARQLAARRIAPSSVQEAEIVVSFESTNFRTAAAATTHGSPFSCSVRILDDRNKEHRQTVLAHCHPHDPKRELRSTRR